MSALVNNRYVKSTLYLFGFILFTILFTIFVLPIASILCEIIFKFGNIVGTFIRSYGC